MLSLFVLSQQINNRPNITRSKAVYGGAGAAPGEFPYFVALTWNRPNRQIYNNFFCGGTLLNSYWVITAQHCVYSFINEAQKISNDEHMLILTSVPGISPTPSPKISYKNIKVYANFVNFDYAGLASQSEVVEMENIGSEITLLKLKSPINISKYPKLPDDDRYYKVSQFFTFMGFGELSLKTSGQNIILEHNNVPNTPSSTLRKASHAILKVGWLSFESEDQTSSFCKGDSGGPAIVREADKDIIIGIIDRTGVIKGGCGPGVKNIFSKTKRLLSLYEINKLINPTPTKTR